MAAPIASTEATAVSTPASASPSVQPLVKTSSLPSFGRSAAAKELHSRLRALTDSGRIDSDQWEVMRGLLEALDRSDVAAPHAAAIVRDDNEDANSTRATVRPDMHTHGYPRRRRVRWGSSASTHMFAGGRHNSMSSDDVDTSDAGPNRAHPGTVRGPEAGTRRGADTGVAVANAGAVAAAAPAAAGHQSKPSSSASATLLTSAPAPAAAPDRRALRGSVTDEDEDDDDDDDARSSAVVLGDHRGQRSVPAASAIVDPKVASLATSLLQRGGSTAYRYDQDLDAAEAVHEVVPEDVGDADVSGDVVAPKFALSSSMASHTGPRAMMLLPGSGGARTNGASAIPTAPAALTSKSAGPGGEVVLTTRSPLEPGSGTATTKPGPVARLIKESSLERAETASAVGSTAAVAGADDDEDMGARLEPHEADVAGSVTDRTDRSKGAEARSTRVTLGGGPETTASHSPDLRPGSAQRGLTQDDDHDGGASDTAGAGDIEHGDAHDLASDWGAPDRSSVDHARVDGNDDDADMLSPRTSAAASVRALPPGTAARHHRPMSYTSDSPSHDDGDAHEARASQSGDSYSSDHEKDFRSASAIGCFPGTVGDADDFVDDDALEDSGSILGLGAAASAVAVASPRAALRAPLSPFRTRAHSPASGVGGRDSASGITPRPLDGVDTATVSSTRPVMAASLAPSIHSDGSTVAGDDVHAECGDAAPVDPSNRHSRKTGSSSRHDALSAGIADEDDMRATVHMNTQLDLDAPTSPISPGLLTRAASEAAGAAAHALTSGAPLRAQGGLSSSASIGILSDTGGGPRAEQDGGEHDASSAISVPASHDSVRARPPVRAPAPHARFGHDEFMAGLEEVLDEDDDDESVGHDVDGTVIEQLVADQARDHDAGDADLGPEAEGMDGERVSQRYRALHAQGARYDLAESDASGRSPHSFGAPRSPQMLRASDEVSDRDNVGRELWRHDGDVDSTARSVPSVGVSIGTRGSIERGPAYGARMRFRAAHSGEHAVAAGSRADGWLPARHASGWHGSSADHVADASPPLFASNVSVRALAGRWAASSPQEFFTRAGGDYGVSSVYGVDMDGDEPSVDDSDHDDYDDQEYGFDDTGSEPEGMEDAIRINDERNHFRGDHPGHAGSMFEGDGMQDEAASRAGEDFPVSLPLPTLAAATTTTRAARSHLGTRSLPLSVSSDSATTPLKLAFVSPSKSVEAYRRSMLVPSIWDDDDRESETHPPEPPPAHGLDQTIMDSDGDEQAAFDRHVDAAIAAYFETATRRAGARHRPDTAKRRREGRRQHLDDADAWAQPTLRPGSASRNSALARTASNAPHSGPRGNSADLADLARSHKPTHAGPAPRRLWSASAASGALRQKAFSSTTVARSRGEGTRHRTRATRRDADAEFILDDSDSAEEDFVISPARRSSSMSANHVSGPPAAAAGTGELPDTSPTYSSARQHLLHALTRPVASSRLQRALHGATGRRAV